MSLWERLFRRERLERELDAELRFHVEEQVRALVASGLDPDEALRLAKIRLGGIEPTKEQCRDVRAGRWLEDVAQDVAYAVRTLRRSRAFAAAVVGTLSLGIGVTTAMYSLLAAIFLQPLPVAEPERLVRVHQEPRRNGFTWPELLAYREQASSVLSRVAGYGNNTVEIHANDGQETFEVEVQAVGGDYFAVLGLQPLVGRLFSAGTDDVDGAAPFVVLGDAIWRRRFAARPDVVGQTMLLNGRRFTIVGVAPRGFRGLQLYAEPALFVPAAMAWAVNSGQAPDATLPRAFSPHHPFLEIVARLRDGVSPAQAEVVLRQIADRLAASGGDASEAKASVRIEPASAGVVNGDNRARLRQFTLMLLSVAAACLLIAISNVGGLLLARAEERRKEIALRLALGATPRRVARQLATEGALLAVVAAGLGTCVAAGLFRALAGFRLPGHVLVGSLGLGLDGRVLASALVIATAAALLFSAAPSWQTRNVDLRTAMATVTTGSSRRPSRVRGALLAAQVALCLPLLLGAGLLLRSLHNAIRVDFGFDPAGIVTVEFPGTSPTRGESLVRGLAERARDLPGAAIVDVEIGALHQSSLFVDGVRREIKGSAHLYGVGPHYFELMGIPAIRGRRFEARDIEGAGKVAIVSESFARLLWPNEDPIGRRFGSGTLTMSESKAKTDTMEVVGVVRDARYSNLMSGPTPSYYVPLSQYRSHRHFLADTVLLRGHDDAALVPLLREQARALDRTLPAPRIRRWIDRIHDKVMPQKMGAFLLVLFGLLALGISAVGLYGLLSYVVTQRTAEIGLRLAIGASRGDVVQLVLRQGSVLLAAGLAAGAALSLWSASLLDRFLYAVEPSDPLTLALAAAALAAVGLLACYLPARRASRIDPMRALRCDG